MFKVPLIVPRVFYLNTRAPITEEFPGKRVNKTLPHGRPNFNLIEVLISNLWFGNGLFPVLKKFIYVKNLQVVVGEDQYKNESKKLTAHVADPEVEVDVAKYCHFRLSY